MTAESSSARAGRGRRIAGGVLLFISVLLVPIGVVAIWGKNEILDTNRYVRTVAPLASNPAVQARVSDRISTALFDAVDLQSEVENLLPDQASRLAAPITSGVQSFVSGQIDDFVASDRFQTLWENANRRAHDQVVKVLTGDGGVVTIKDGMVVVDLQEVAVQVRDILDQRGVTLFDSLSLDRLDIQIELFDASSIQQARFIFKILETLAWAIPVVVLVLLAAGLWLSSDRRRSLFRWAVGVAVACLALGLILTIGRAIAVSGLANSSGTEAATASFNILTRFLRDSNRALIVFGLLVALVVGLTGDSRPAVAIRRYLGDDAGDTKVGGYLGRNIRNVWIGLTVVMALFFMFSNDPSRTFTVVVVGVYLIALAASVVMVGGFGEAWSRLTAPWSDHEGSDPPAAPAPPSPPVDGA